jgi:hypothetical protein
LVCLNTGLSVEKTIEQAGILKRVLDTWKF